MGQSVPFLSKSVRFFLWILLKASAFFFWIGGQFPPLIVSGAPRWRLHSALHPACQTPGFHHVHFWPVPCMHSNLECVYPVKNWACAKRNNLSLVVWLLEFSALPPHPPYPALPPGIVQGAVCDIVSHASRSSCISVCRFQATLQPRCRQREGKINLASPGCALQIAPVLNLSAIGGENGIPDTGKSKAMTLGR